MGKNNRQIPPVQAVNAVADLVNAPIQAVNTVPEPVTAASVVENLTTFLSGIRATFRQDNVNVNDQSQAKRPTGTIQKSTHHGKQH